MCIRDSNNATAFIGDSAVVDATNVLTVQSETSNPFAPTLFGGLGDPNNVQKKYQFNPSTRVDLTNNTINLGADHGLNTGDEVTYIPKGNAIGGLEDGKTYTIEKVNEMACLLLGVNPTQMQKS